MHHNPTNYYQIYKTDHRNPPEMIAEVKGRGNAQIRVEALNLGRTSEEIKQDISYYMSNSSSSRRQMTR
jgi:hypothetical protein